MKFYCPYLFLMMERYQPAHQLFTRNITIRKTLQSIAFRFFTSQLTGTDYPPEDPMLDSYAIVPKQVLREMRRVVRPGGYLMIVDGYHHRHVWTLTEVSDFLCGIDRLLQPFVL